MMCAASGVRSLPTRSTRVAASNNRARTSSGESTPFTTSLRTNACRIRAPISPCPVGAAFPIMMISCVIRPVILIAGLTPSREVPLEILVQLLERSAQTVELIHQMKDDVDALVVDAEIGFQVPDEMCPRNVDVGEAHSGGSLLWNEPPLLEPEIQRLHLEARTGQELLLVHDHDVLSSRGLNALPLSQFETNASSSGSGGLGKTTFSLTN